ncbi:DUF1294 domain-containing protein [Phenylobacterium sp.]|uniref:DUF1294 domain-containing protein n=1 Tax=Phenylobacterium sp. TaxID=1871053 RepID=UPI00286C619F|nr:DUF1294 domain-containing protein [Phenylobacterium sp.]
MILLYLAVINVAAFAAMGWDKSSARRGVERISERTLLTLAAAGGSLGAVAAQQLFRHKTRKQPFATGLPGIVGVPETVGPAITGRAPD